MENPSDTVCTADCINKCRDVKIIEEDKAHIYVYCPVKEKKFIYGKMIDCNEVRRR